ncbi:hypothetical protein AB4072_03325 [Microvirga sp. 2MCAF38]|uniref:hypothetical protein n=1 Tax=Microvirga sp. 2MCAF38 TaxID=3232989 RepID=UPI003F95E6AD
MSIHIIDASRPLPPAYADFQHALRLEESDTVILAAGASIEAYGIEAHGIVGHFGTTLLIDGNVLSQHGTGILTSGAITIGLTGSVKGYYSAIDIYENRPGSPSSTLTNLGRIETEEGVGVKVFDPNATILNVGTISGVEGINFDSYGFEERTDQLKIVNTGLIQSDGRAITGLMYGSNTVVNTGHIIGDVFLGGRAWVEPAGPPTNIYDGRGGTLTGTVYFSSGNDIAYGGDGNETFSLGANVNFVDGGGGNDTIFYYAPGTSVDLRITERQQTGAYSWDTIHNVESLFGSVFSDRFTGNDQQNTLTGNRGNDTLDGQGGDDILNGGEGSDDIRGGAGVDIAAYSGSFADYTISQQANGSVIVTDNRGIVGAMTDGIDTLNGIEYLQFSDRTIALAGTTNRAPTSVDLSSRLVDGDAPVGTLVATLSGVDPDGDALGYHLVSNPGGHFRIHGNKLLVDRAFTDRDADITITVRASDPHGASIDRSFVIDVAADVISIPPGEIPGPIVELPLVYPMLSSLTLTGGKKADVLKGGTGDDLLNGGLGMDKLTGQGGADVFAFTTKLGRTNVDRILDFQSDEDTISLSKAVFSKLRKGVLSDKAFWVGSQAHDASDRIVYNEKTGALSYDADGSGTKHAAVKFAQLKVGTLLTAHDFFIA